MESLLVKLFEGGPPAHPHLSCSKTFPRTSNILIALTDHQFAVGAGANLPEFGRFEIAEGFGATRVVRVDNWSMN